MRGGHGVEIFIQALLIGYSGAIMPGSLLTYTLNESLKFGAKSGLIISMGHALLEMGLVILIFFGIGDYLSTPIAQLIISISGGLVLVFLGINMIKDSLSDKVGIDLKESSEIHYGNLLAGGALLSASNPYFLVWWATIGLGLIMNAYKYMGILGIALVYFGHITADITWYVFVAALVGKTRSFINPRVYKTIIIILGCCLCGFGIKFLVSALKIFSGPGL